MLCHVQRGRGLRSFFSVSRSLYNEQLQLYIYIYFLLLLYSRINVYGIQLQVSTRVCVMYTTMRVKYAARVRSIYYIYELTRRTGWTV